MQRGAADQLSCAARQRRQSHLQRESNGREEAEPPAVQVASAVCGAPVSSQTAHNNTEESNRGGMNMRARAHTPLCPAAPTGRPCGGSRRTCRSRRSPSGRHCARIAPRPCKAAAAAGGGQGFGGARGSAGGQCAHPRDAGATHGLQISWWGPCSSRARYKDPLDSLLLGAELRAQTSLLHSPRLSDGAVGSAPFPEGFSSHCRDRALPCCVSFWLCSGLHCLHLQLRFELTVVNSIPGCLPTLPLSPSAPCQMPC